MTSYVNNTFVNGTLSERGSTSLIWLPYVIITVVCVVLLAINFYCYHRKHRERYQRKAEVIETRERVLERRMILNMVKARYLIQCEDDSDNSSTDSGTILARTREFNRLSKNGIAQV